MAEFDNNDNNANINNTSENDTLVQDGLMDNVLTKPETGRVVVETQANETYSVGFDANQADLAIENGDLVFNFNDGTQLVLDNFAEISPMPTLMLPDGTILAGDVIVAQLSDPSTDVFNLETAAGPGAGAGGQFSYSDDFGDVIDLIDNLPPLPFTTLAFNTFTAEEIDPEAINNPGTFTPNFFTPFSAGVSGGFEDWQPNQHIGDNSVFPMQLVINYTPPAGDNDVVDAINVADIPAGTLVFIGTPGVPGSFTAVNVVNGEINISSADLGSQSIFMLPPADSDVDFTVTVNLTTSDPDTGEVTVLTNTATAVIDAVADIPEVDGTVSLADGTVDGSAVTGADGQNISFNVDIDFSDNDGSEVHTITVTGVPQEWSLISDGGLNATETVNADGTVTYTVTVGVGFDGTLQFDPGAWNSDDFGGSATVTFTATAEEVNVDGEILLSNNEASDSQSFTVTLNDSGPSVVAVSGPVSLNEDDLTIAGADTIDGVITVDFGNDGPGDISIKTDGLNALNLTSGGEPLSYQVSADGLTLTAVDASGDVVFTVTIDPTPVMNGSQATYTYTFELLQPLDHDLPVGADDSVIDIPVCFTATDTDGDTIDGEVNLQVVDDLPITQGQSTVVDETDDLGVSFTGDLPVDFGADGAGSPYEGNDDFSSSVNLTSGGQPVDVDYDAGTYTGTLADGTVVFTLTINSDGTYTYTQDLPLDHPDATDPDDEITLSFGYTTTDFDGDAVEGELTIRVNDDGPVAVDDVATINSGDPQVITGNVIDNDDVGSDIEGTLTEISVGGNTLTFAADGQTDANGTYIEVDGQYGTLQIYEDGSYTYTVTNPPVGAAGTFDADLFDYVLVDADGDPSSASVTINVANIVPINPVDVQDQVDETLINQTVSDVITVTGGTDFTLTGDFSSGGSQTDGTLTSNGVPVTVSFVGGQFIGMAAGEVIFTLDLNNDGTYTFNLFGNLDHADGNNPNDIINLNFTYEVSGPGTPTVQGNIQIDVLDDIPTVRTQGIGALDETDDFTQSVSGNIDVDFGNDGQGSIEGNDSFSATGSVAGGTLTSGGQDIEVTVSDGTYTGALTDGTVVFTMTVNDDGSYEFNLNAPLDHADTTDPNDIINLNFGYGVTDYDGDTVDTDITIAILDDGPVAVDDVATINSGDPQVITGNVIDNDDVGSDIEGTLTEISVGGNTLTFAADGQTDANGTYIEVDGQYGTLQIYEDGSYTYTVTNPPVGAAGTFDADLFDYVLVDADGDPSSASVTINVANTMPITPVNIKNEVDETDIYDTVSDNVGVVGATGYDLGDINGNLDFSFTGSVANGNLTSNGIPVTVSLIGGQIVGMAGGELIFTLDLNNAGTYTFDLVGNLDHADGNDANDVIELNFTYTVENANGQVVEGNISIDVLDDAPVASPDLNVFTGLTADGNVLTGEGSVDQNTASDDYGADGAGSVTQVEFNGTIVTFANDAQTDANGTYVEIDGDHGTLQLYSDGSYTYTLNGTQQTTASFDIDASDIVGQPTSVTDNGITISVGDGDYLTFFDGGPTLGSGFGIGSSIDNTPKIFNGESINIGFDTPANTVTVTLADIGANDAGDSVGILVYFAPNQYIVVEQVLPNPVPANGLFSITLDADALGIDNIYQIELFTGDAHGLQCDAAFLLADVDATYVETGLTDDFTYTISDYDGDEASSTLSFEASDPAGRAAGEDFDIGLITDNEESNAVLAGDAALIIHDDKSGLDMPINDGPATAGDDNMLVNADGSINMPDPVPFGGGPLTLGDEINTLNVSDLLTDSSYEPGVSDISQYLHVDSQTGNVELDVTGTGNFSGENVVTTIENVSTFDTINVVLNDDEGDIPVQIV